LAKRPKVEAIRNPTMFEMGKPEQPKGTHDLSPQYARPMDTCMPVWYRMTMKRTALFLKEEQLKKLLMLSEKTGAPVAELIRRAIDRYLQERSKELK
jgi:hypothetical protein